MQCVVAAIQETGIKLQDQTNLLLAITAGGPDILSAMTGTYDRYCHNENIWNV